MEQAQQVELEVLVDMALWTQVLVEVVEVAVVVVVEVVVLVELVVVAEAVVVVMVDQVATTVEVFVVC